MVVKSKKISSLDHLLCGSIHRKRARPADVQKDKEYYGRRYNGYSRKTYERRNYIGHSPYFLREFFLR